MIRYLEATGWRISPAARAAVAEALRAIAAELDVEVPQVHFFDRVSEEEIAREPEQARETGLLLPLWSGFVSEEPITGRCDRVTHAIWILHEADADLVQLVEIAARLCKVLAQPPTGDDELPAEREAEAHEYGRRFASRWHLDEAHATYVN